MSVTLFSRDEVYADLASAYEALKPTLRQHHYLANGDADDHSFYKSLRRLSFANMAAYLCQYHDGATPLSATELAEIDTFSEMPPITRIPGREPSMHAHLFLDAWARLRYNLTTNDGEQFIPRQAYDYIDALAMAISRSVLADSAGASDEEN